MPSPRKPKEDEITRRDIQESIADLKKQLLDPDAPSLLSMVKSELGGINIRMGEHDRKVDRVISDFAEFKELYAADKQSYAADKGTVKGWLLGAGAGGGVGLAAAIKTFFFTK